MLNAYPYRFKMPPKILYQLVVLHSFSLSITLAYIEQLVGFELLTHGAMFILLIARHRASAKLSIEHVPCKLLRALSRYIAQQTVHW